MIFFQETLDVKNCIGTWRKKKISQRKFIKIKKNQNIPILTYFGIKNGISWNRWCYSNILTDSLPRNQEKSIHSKSKESLQHCDHPVLTHNLYAGFDKYFLNLKPSTEEECSDSELRSGKVNPHNSRQFHWESKSEN